MNFLRLALLVGVTTLTAGMAAYTSVQAQPGAMTYDGATFAGQSMDTQTLFNATWGSRAAEMWATQHNAELVAAGFSVPQPVMTSAPMGDQSGAQVSNDNDSNDNESNDNDADDDDDDDDKNDNS